MLDWQKKGWRATFMNVGVLGAQRIFWTFFYPLAKESSGMWNNII